MTLEWQEHAACIGKPTDWFFPPEHGSPSLYEAGRAVCNGCPVKSECLAWSLENGDVYHGMFGGKTPRERQRMDRGGTFLRYCGCGTRFMTPSRSRMYCSKVCRQRAYQERSKLYRVRKHGRAGYVAGCYCDVCRAAQTEYDRERYQQRKKAQ